MTPESKLENKWALIENVFELLESDGRQLMPGEKQVIAGQRVRNGVLYHPIGAILATFPADDSAPQGIKDARYPHRHASRIPIAAAMPPDVRRGLPRVRTQSSGRSPISSLGIGEGSLASHQAA